jgi:AmmeMemoRadiSam system protein B
MAVPLLVGDATPSEVAAALNQLSGGSETVIVVSSDLSHFPMTRLPVGETPLRQT